jgi:glycosyltransferase involved in cell wall biosynthesis
LKVLHIAGGFAQHGLYIDLVRHLRDVCRFQLVFAPVRSAAEMSRQPPDEPGAVTYDYRHMLRPYHRVFFGTKIHTICRQIVKSINPSEFSLIHAHTLYSDGAVALRLHKRFSVPYIATVRNTDLNIFMRFRPDLRWVARAVLRRARQIVFLSPAYRQQFLSRLHNPLREEVKQKSIVLANGLDSFWLEPFSKPTRDSGSQLRILYVGDFSDNKNVPNLLRAADVLAKRMPIQLTLVGGGGSGDRQIRNAIASDNYPFARIYGRVDDSLELRSLYRDHDIFVMPSFKETFGVVYLEALSQGLPIVHSRGQGVDGFFPPGTVSESVDPHSIDNIAASIELLAERLEKIRYICTNEARKFAWNSIALQYEELYRSISPG